MAYTTTFTHDYEGQTYKNFLDPIYWKRADGTGDALPSNMALVSVQKVAWTFNGRLYSGFDKRNDLYICSEALTTTSGAIVYAHVGDLYVTSSTTKNWFDNTVGQNNDKLLNNLYNNSKGLQIYVTTNRNTYTTASGDGRSIKMVITWDYAYTKCTAPTNVYVNTTIDGVTTQVNDFNAGYAKTVTLRWSAGTKGTNNDITGYQVRYSDTENGTYSDLPNGKLDSSTRYLSISAKTVNNGKAYYKIRTLGSHTGYDSDDSTVRFCLTAKAAVVTTKPAITKLSVAKGSSVTATCSAAVFDYSPHSNQGYTLTYQWFCGLTSTYNANYVVTTTTSTSYTFTESDLVNIGKATGANKNGTPLYLYVRAYYAKESTSKMGSYDPTAYSTPFYYFPTINKPTSVKITPTNGQSTTVTWKNVANGAGTNCNTYIYINGTKVTDSNVFSSATNGYLLTKGILNNFDQGNLSIQVAHQWYGTTNKAAAVTFYYDKDRLIYYYTDSKWKPCNVFRYNSTTGSWEECYVYQYDGSKWVQCDG